MTAQGEALGEGIGLFYGALKGRALTIGVERALSGLWCCICMCTPGLRPGLSQLALSGQCVMLVGLLAVPECMSKLRDFLLGSFFCYRHEEAIS